MNKRIAAALIVLSGAVGLAPTTRADTLPLSCNSGRFSFSGEVSFSVDGPFVHWDTAGGAVDGTGQDKNNINFWLQTAFDGLVRTCFSPDNLDDGEWYSCNLDYTVPIWNDSRLSFEAVFDKSGSDPRCSGGV
jgi:hypothetical protein